MAGTDQRGTCVCRAELATSRWIDVSINAHTALPVVVDDNFIGQKHEHANESTLMGKELGGPLIPNIYDHRFYLIAYTYQ